MLMNLFSPYLSGKYDVAGTVKYFTVNETVTGRVTWCRCCPAWPLTWHHQTVWQHHCPLHLPVCHHPSTSLSVLTIPWEPRQHFLDPHDEVIIPLPWSLARCDLGDANEGILVTAQVSSWPREAQLCPVYSPHLLNHNC